MGQNKGLFQRDQDRKRLRREELVNEKCPRYCLQRQRHCKSYRRTMSLHQSEAQNEKVDGLTIQSST